MSRTFAHFFSIVGHPMLVLTYALVLLLLINPYAFGVHSPADRKAVLLLLYVFTTTALIPGVGIAIMKPLGFIKNLESPDRLERTGAYIVTGAFYLWLFKNLNGSGQVPPLYLVCVLSATIALFVAFFINIFTKISAHTTGMGGLVGMLMLTARDWEGAMLNLPAFGGTVQVSLIVALAAMVVLAGLVGSARLVLKAHVPRDLWQGYLVGFASVWIARAII